MGLVAVTLAGLLAGKLVPFGGTEKAPGRLFCISRSFLMAALAAVAAWRGTLVLFNGRSGVPSAASSILKRVCRHMTGKSATSDQMGLHSICEPQLQWLVHK